MDVAVTIERTLTEKKVVEVSLDLDDLLHDSVEDAVETKVANDEFEVLDEDIHVQGGWEVEEIA